MTAFEHLGAFFSGEEEVAAAYLYGQPATDRTWPDSDIEIGLLFRNTMTPEAVAEYLEGLTSSNPLGESPGILMPFALNAHILPVIHEVLTWGQLVADNDPTEREGFVRRMTERLEQERPRLLEEAHESIMQARTFGLPTSGDPVPTMAQFSRPLDPVRIGWRFGRVLTSVPIIEMFTRDVEAVAQDAERVTQIIGVFGNASGAATGIAKAMLTTFGIPRPSRRWEVFLPLADIGIIPMELALQLAAMVETRWTLLSGSGAMVPERVISQIRAYLPPIITFARRASWTTELPGLSTNQRLH
ncbi:MAG TPA: nucleotidyltransferase domain-containing protein [bacterium]|nr:nucleotidyltransferase domain-containing protein [bacterium]